MMISKRKHTLSPEQYNMFIYKDEGTENLVFLYSIDKVDKAIVEVISKQECIEIYNIIKKSKNPFIFLINNNIQYRLILEVETRQTLCKVISNYYNLLS